MSQTVLEEAANIIDGARNATYGDATEEFTQIAAAWSAYKGIEITPLDYANMLIIMKVMRARRGWHRDSYVDICGYSALAERVQGKQEQKSSNESPLIKKLNEASWTLPPRPTLPRCGSGSGGSVGSWDTAAISTCKPFGTIQSGLISSEEGRTALTKDDADQLWISEGNKLVYWFVDGEWWVAREFDIPGSVADDRDPWRPSMYGGTDVPAVQGPFKVYTGPLC